MNPPKEISVKTRKEVYERWRGKCAFCGIDLPLEDHHIISIKDDPSLINDPNNSILVCENHHGLTLSKKPNGTPAISFKEIQDLEKSAFAKLEKRGFYFSIPQNFSVSLGGNICSMCPYVLVVNGKPLIEIWAQKPASYVDEMKIFLYMRFFDENNNFIGGMFANHWASVVNEEWKLNILENEIRTWHIQKPIFVNFKRDKNIVTITGQFYFDGIKILVTDKELILPRENRFVGCSVTGCEVAFNINGNSESVSFAFGGKLK